MPGNLSSIALAEEEALATEGKRQKIGEKRMFYTYILRCISQPEQRYIGSTADLKSRLTKHMPEKFRIPLINDLPKTAIQGLDVKKRRCKSWFSATSAPSFILPK